ncbi:uncharacterized protein LOC128888435 isoform X2 [Hylaeus anthracinus]|uniref:uncharacterized protein LOC128888435 isoform X2 n=1 Tax=Hylaeus anthracinus TaxID=313031 RepID=UPI0023B91BFD|nr:uncharacterized protein LOC128888435 isoform X2 [Hylaeus anthracinus]
MWAPVISILWTIVYMVQRKITMKSIVYPSYSETAEAHRALELLEDYHAKLTRPQDKQLRLAIERVIRIFKSRLFQALLGKKLKLLTRVTSFGSLNFM